MYNKDALNIFKADLKMAVADAVDAKVTANGGVNQATMKAQPDKFLVELRTKFCAGSQSMHQTNLGTEDSIEVDTTVHILAVYQFHYKDDKGNMRFWCVPESFCILSRNQQVEWLEEVALQNISC
jgi:hypothetical protein